MPDELTVQRQLTTAFINQLPVTITLIPHERVKAPDGGFTDDPGTPRPPQVMSLVETSGVNSMPQFPAQGTDGRELRVSFELVAEWDAEMGLYDRFTVPGQTGEWRVEQLFFENGWERRAAVNKLG